MPVKLADNGKFNYLATYFFNSLIIFSVRIVILTKLSVNISPDKKTAEMSNCIKFHIWL